MFVRLTAKVNLHKIKTKNKTKNSNIQVLLNVEFIFILGGYTKCSYLVCLLFLLTQICILFFYFYLIHKYKLPQNSNNNIVNRCLIFLYRQVSNEECFWYNLPFLWNMFHEIMLVDCTKLLRVLSKNC